MDKNDGSRNLGKGISLWKGWSRLGRSGGKWVDSKGWLKKTRPLEPNRSCNLATVFVTQPVVMTPESVLGTRNLRLHPRPPQSEATFHQDLQRTRAHLLSEKHCLGRRVRQGQRKLLQRTMKSAQHLAIKLVSEASTCLSIQVDASLVGSRKMYDLSEN